MTEHCAEGAEPIADDPVNPSDVRLAAMNLLARREHSQVELRQKLRRRFSDEQVIDEQLHRLADEKLQSDERYAESFVRQRINRGHGPLRIERDARVKGIERDTLRRILRDEEVDWSELAGEVLRKKFGVPVAPSGGGRVGSGAPMDTKDKARRLRFMQYRGFDVEHYRHLLDD